MGDSLLIAGFHAKAGFTEFHAKTAKAERKGRKEKKETTPGPSFQQGGEPYPSTPVTEREGRTIIQKKMKM